MSSAITQTPPTANASPPLDHLAFRQAAAGHGWCLVRLQTGGKAPRDRNWTQGQDQAVLLREEPALRNTGIIAHGLRVIDVDADSPATVTAILAAANKHLPMAGALVRQRDGTPRVALVIRSAEGAPEKRAVAGVAGKVEVLGAGQQLHAHGLHPSGVPVRWQMDRGPHTVPLADVSQASEAAITAFLAECAPTLGAALPVLVTSSHGLGPLPASMSGHLVHDGEFSAGVPLRIWFDDLPPMTMNACVRACFGAIDNHTSDPREGWLRLVFAAADAEARGATDARDAALDWSRHGAGWTGEGAFNVAWNSARPGAITVATLLHSAKVEGLDLSPFRAAVQGAAVAPSPNSPFTSATFTTAGARRDRPVLGNLLARGVVSLLAAKTKVGKTALLVSAALSLASGRDLLGLPVLLRPLRVLLINGEDGRDMLMLRFRAALHHHGIQEADVKPFLRVVTANDARGLRLTQTVGSKEALNPAGIAALTDLVDGMEGGCDVVLLDPLMAFLGSSVNTNEVMAAVMLALNTLARERDLALLVAHHLRKGSTVDGDGLDAATGASALTNHCRIAAGLVPMTEGEAPKLGVLPSDAWRFSRLAELGSNYAPPTAAQLWLERISVTVPGTAELPDYPDDGTAPVTCKATLAGPAGLVRPAMQLAALRAIHGGVAGVPLSDHPRAKDRAALPVIAAALAPHLPALSEPQRQAVARQVLADSIHQGWIRVDPAARVPRLGGNGSDARRGLRVEWPATPWPDATASTATSPHHIAVDTVGEAGALSRGHRNVALGGVGGVAVDPMHTAYPSERAGE